MSNPTDRSRPHAPTGPQDGLLAADEVSLPRVSRGEAAAYIGDMAASLRRIAEGSELPDLARLLERVEAEAQSALKKAHPQSRRGTR